MKSKFLFVCFYFLLSITEVFALQDYITKKETVMYDVNKHDELTRICSIPKHTILDKLSEDSDGISIFSGSPMIYIKYNGKFGWVYAENLSLNNSDLFDENILCSTDDIYYIRYFYFDILKQRNIYAAEKYLSKSIKNYEEMTGDMDEPWISYLYFNKSFAKIYDITIQLNQALSWNSWMIKNIKKENDYYKIRAYCYEWGDEDSLLIDNYYPQEGKEYNLYLKNDGDYIIFNFEKTENYMSTYVKTDLNTINQIQNFILEGSCDFLKVTWPRHADGSCDYDGSSKKVTAANTSQSKTSEATKAVSNTNVAVNKTMSTNCNLKLRSGEATSTQVLTVMAAGTKVKILELGKAEKIDGISSNWVRVEVQKNAKDRDGKEIKAGTVGWCYGGYLE